MRGLYNGKIIPWERKQPRNDELLEVVRKIEDEERYFVGKMSLDDCQRFQALSKLYSELNSIEDENAFAYGFTLGMLLMMDVTEEATACSPSCGGR